MELTSDQKKTVAKWITDGDGLSEVQRKLSSEFGMTMTFMDVRFLVDDLGVTLKNKPVSISKNQSLQPASDQTAAPDADPGYEDGVIDEPAPVPADGVLSNVSIDIDVVMKPGTVVSGNVVFSDGVKASWALDTYGRLALGASKEGYKPSQADIQAFQQELGRQLKKRGF